MLTTSPDPRPGRSMGGGCFDWLADGSGVVYVGVDGELWLQRRVGQPRRLTAFERSCAAPAVAPNSSFVVAVVDEAEVWLVPIGADDLASRRLDDGRDAFCFDPAISPAGDEVCWQAWSPPDMPWDGAHACRLPIADPSTAQVQRWRPDDGAVQQPRYAPGGAPTCVHDGSGWLNVYVGDRPAMPERIEQSGPTWGMGLRTYVVAPDERAVAVCRNELGFGRLTIVDLDGDASTIGGSTDVGRACPRPGLVGRRLDRGIAVGRPDPHADRALRRGGVRTHGPRGRPRRRMGRDRPPRAGARRPWTRRHRPARPSVRVRRGAPARVGARRPDRSMAGRLPPAPRLLVEPWLGRARGRPAGLHRPRARVPAGVERRMGTARCRRHGGPRVGRPRPWLGRPGHDRGDGRVVGRAVGSRTPRRPW